MRDKNIKSYEYKVGNRFLISQKEKEYMKRFIEKISKENNFKNHSSRNFTKIEENHDVLIYLDETGDISMTYDINSENINKYLGFIQTIADYRLQNFGVIYKTTDDVNREEELESIENKTKEEARELLRLKLIFQPRELKLFDEYVDISKDYIDIGREYGMYKKFNKLSNFEEYHFVMNGVKCSSMEGFLQSLKFKDEEEQKEVCLLVGKQAKFKGQNKKWYADNHTLYWKGKSIDRYSMDYIKLVAKAYNRLWYQNKGYRELLSSTNKTIAHTLGNKNMSYTVLTEEEFTNNLNRLRKENIENYKFDESEII